MVTLLDTTSSPLVRVMVAGVATAKQIVSPSAALASASRKEPGPLSLMVVTAVQGLACAALGPNVAPSRARHNTADQWWSESICRVEMFMLIGLPWCGFGFSTRELYRA